MVSFKLPTTKALANVSVTATVHKSKKPKFEVHLKIFDLNNVPLVSGTSFIKWHLPHSLHSEHRGRTHKCHITNHRVEYNYDKSFPVRIAIDKNNNLSECPLELEILQEFSDPSSAGSTSALSTHHEKISLGKVSLNLSEYVEESEAILRVASRASGEAFRRSSMAAGSASFPLEDDHFAAARDAAADEDGVVRRYLMQESKINSTLKLGILMVQIDGERSFVAPPLRTAPVFGGIAGIMAAEPGVDGTASVAGSGGSVHGFEPEVVGKGGRDASELQDMYRRSLAASWACPGGEVPADECIEDIFSGGTGFKKGVEKRKKDRGREVEREESDESNIKGLDASATLRPQDVRAMMRHHMRTHSGASEGTVTRGSGISSRRQHGDHSNGSSPRERSGNSGGGNGGGDLRSRSGSLTSMATATTMGSDRGREGFRRARALDEGEVRDDLVAWRLPGTVS